MPRKPKKPCAHPGCPELTEGRYCEAHKKQREQEYDRFNRDQKSKKFYDSPEWRRVRRQKISDYPVCEVCESKPADLVHHKREVKDCWDIRLDMDNLQSICHTCHNKQHNRKG